MSTKKRVIKADCKAKAKEALSNPEPESQILTKYKTSSAGGVLVDHFVPNATFYEVM
jgi:hypothetical protein